MSIDPIESKVGILELNENQNDDNMIQQCERSFFLSSFLNYGHA